MTEEKKPLPGVMDYFPLKTARATQKLVIEEIDKVFKTGKKIVILEAPVGSGKSAIALTLARQEAANPSKIVSDESKVPPAPVHIITPRKSLQDQYYADFPKDVVTMKGRNSYPCIMDFDPGEYIPILRAISDGRVVPPTRDQVSCNEAPCLGIKAIYKECTQDRACPYTLAITTAQASAIIVHNLHSFIYQTSYSERFQKRSLLIVDEAHEIETTMRDFATRKIYVAVPISREEIKDLQTTKDWIDFLSQSKFVPELTPKDIAQKLSDPNFESKHHEYLRKVASLGGENSVLEKGFAVEWTPYFSGTLNSGPQKATALDFVPNYVGGETNRLLLAFGHKVLLMSGTIYDKKAFCAQLGIAADDAHFIRIPSTFPREDRPIYLKQEYQVETSHAKWNENFPEMIGIIKKILSIFHDAKGLIHVPSYKAGNEIAAELRDPRVWTHEASNFLSRLESFYESKGNGVFISPVCQQGVDFKEDRARFQIVLRVPYMNTSSAFVSNKLKTDFAWYNYQALIVFGQQVGRVNRGPGDYGATFLVDSRFRSFISKNRGVLPKWLQESFIYK